MFTLFSQVQFSFLDSLQVPPAPVPDLQVTQSPEQETPQSSATQQQQQPHHYQVFYELIGEVFILIVIHFGKKNLGSIVLEQS